MKTKVARHKNKNQFVMYLCLKIRFVVFCDGIFYFSFVLMKYPYTKTIHLDLQTRIHHSLVLVIVCMTG